MKKLLMGALACLLLAACKKKEQENITMTEQRSALDFSMFLSGYLDAIKVAEDVMDSNYGARIMANNISCSNISIDSNGTYKLYTINFSNTCADYDGFYRSGKLFVRVSNSSDKRYNRTGAITEITFDNLIYKEFQLDGKIRLECLDSARYNLRIKGSDGNGNASIRYQNTGETAFWSADLYRVTTSGANDVFLLNNDMEISGESESNFLGKFTNTYGNSYSVTFSAKLRQNNSCYSEGFGRIPVAGDIIFTSDSDSDDDFKLTYGSGTCDNTATISRNNTNREVTY
ncbi:MAG: hypothetical protein MUF42_11800 [Cytophagaceae bacterium]|jgi:hypothetical protein|nr:hypothetical protein [Cytophagaceae bacterium]